MSLPWPGASCRHHRGRSGSPSARQVAKEGLRPAPAPGPGQRTGSSKWEVVGGVDRLAPPSGVEIGVLARTAEGRGALASSCSGRWQGHPRGRAGSAHTGGPPCSGRRSPGKHGSARGAPPPRCGPWPRRRAAPIPWPRARRLASPAWQARGRHVASGCATPHAARLPNQSPVPRRAGRPCRARWRSGAPLVAHWPRRARPAAAPPRARRRRSRMGPRSPAQWSRRRRSGRRRESDPRGLVRASSAASTWPGTTCFAGGRLVGRARGDPWPALLIRGDRVWQGAGATAIGRSDAARRGGGEAARSPSTRRRRGASPGARRGEVGPAVPMGMVARIVAWLPSDVPDDDPVAGRSSVARAGSARRTGPWGGDGALIRWTGEPPRGQLEH